MSRACWLWGGAMAAALCIAAPPSAGHAGGAGELTATATKASPPNALLGRWEVKRVLLDLADQPHWGMIRPADPSLLYRSMTIAQDKIWFVGANKSCDQVSWKPLVTTWQALFQTTGISRAPSNSASTRVKPVDYGLRMDPQARIRAFPVCQRGARLRGKTWRDAGWMVLEGDELIVRYSGQVIVVLTKRTEAEKPEASFPCDEAGSPAEKAICSDRELAAWDRSVAEALRQALDRRTDGGDRERIMKSQAAWKAQRDKCGTEAACIRDALDERVTELIQE